MSFANKKKKLKLVVKSKKTADAVVASLKNNSQGVAASVRSPSHIGVLKRVPEDFDEQSLKPLIPNAVKILQCGTSRVFKVNVESRTELEFFLRNSVKIHYEKLPAQPFVFLPKRCYKCHLVGHLAAECTNQPKCSKCGSTDHTSDRLNKCNQPAFCTSCNSSGHTCYSVRCPKNTSTKADMKSGVSRIS
jgi:hypothetical protein